MSGLSGFLEEERAIATDRSYECGWRPFLDSIWTPQWGSEEPWGLQVFIEFGRAAGI